MPFYVKTLVFFGALTLGSGLALAQADVMSSMNPAGMALMGEASGTSMNPAASTQPSMLMTNAAGWNWMFMGEAFVVDTQQASPRGHDKLFSTNWLMAGAEHHVGKGSIMVRLMLSLEPATITDRRYPELFQTGETAYGLPLVDAQHPHNFIMGLSVTYAHPLGDAGLWEIYYAPVGDPALGPVAFPHRASAVELPQAPLGHHWEDSTHIAYNVATTAFTYKKLRWEASGFHGAEPGENRWIVTYGAMDSWATRISVLPNSHWLAQFSAGRLNRPEATSNGDVVRTTASVHYTKTVRGGDWSSSLIWGRNHYTDTKQNGDAYTFETVRPLNAKNILTGRAELVDKDELFDTVPSLAGRSFQIGAYTFGYTRELTSPLKIVDPALGANFTLYSLPAAIKPYYGNIPWGVDFFLRIRLKQPH
jgi:hypothetical protein